MPNLGVAVALPCLINPLAVVPDPVAESTEEEEDDSLSYFSKLVNS